MRVPSGDQTACVTSSLRLVSLRGSPPATGITNSCEALSERLEVNASCVPSGDQRGSPSAFSPVVNRRGGADPSTAASQIAALYSLASLSTDPTTYATVVPSGESRGSATPVSS